MMKPIQVGLLAILVVFAASETALAQRGSSSSNQGSMPASNGSSNMPNMNTNRSGFPMGRDPMMNPMGFPEMANNRMAEQQAKIRNNERQKKIQTDTEKLVDLVNELKNQIDAEKAMAPADLGKRAEEIEKLAKSVKERMKG